MPASVSPSQVSINLLDFPVDIVLEIITFLPLKSLIAARGVHSVWRKLVPKAALMPARRKMLELYDDAIASPMFLPSRKYILPNLKRFKRQGYIDAIIDKAGSVPFELQLWILEWPARALLNRCWPGIGYEFASGMEDLDDYGSNLLLNHPRVHNVSIYQNGVQRLIEAPCLKLWYHGCTCNTVLILKCDEKRIEGAVYATDEDATDDIDDPEVRLASSWLDYQRYLLARKEKAYASITTRRDSKLLSEMFSDSESSDSEC